MTAGVLLDVDDCTIVEGKGNRGAGGAGRRVPFSLHCLRMALQ